MEVETASMLFFCLFCQLDGFSACVGVTGSGVGMTISAGYAGVSAAVAVAAGSPVAARSISSVVAGVGGVGVIRCGIPGGGLGLPVVFGLPGVFRVAGGLGLTAGFGISAGFSLPGGFRIAGCVGGFGVLNHAVGAFGDIAPATGKHGQGQRHTEGQN